MESTIKWETGLPTEIGRYIITKKDGKVSTVFFHPKEILDLDYFESLVIAWCLISDIEPYKEEAK